MGLIHFLAKHIQLLYLSFLLKKRMSILFDDNHNLKNNRALVLGRGRHSGGQTSGRAAANCDEEKSDDVWVTLLNGLCNDTMAPLFVLQPNTNRSEKRRFTLPLLSPRVQ